MKPVIIIAIAFVLLLFTIPAIYAYTPPDVGTPRCIENQVYDPGLGRYVGTGSCDSNTGSNLPPFSPMDFTVRTNVSGIDAEVCTQNKIKVTVTYYRGSQEWVNLEATNWKSSGITTTFDFNKIKPGSQSHSTILNVYVSCNTPPDNYPITVRGYTNYRQSNDMVVVRVIPSQTSQSTAADNYFQNGNYVKAASSYKSALDFGGKSDIQSPLNNKVGVSYAMQGYDEFGKIHQSVFYFQTAIQMDPGNQVAKNNLKIINAIIKNPSQIDQLQNLSIPGMSISNTRLSNDYYDDTSSGGCLIATATYGSELAPQVQMLREIRDNQLLNTASGTAFINSFNEFYYSFSPIIADYERENPVFREMVKIAITPMITSLSILNYVDIDSEESVLGYGISLILLNVGMYFVVPVIAFVGIRKKF